MLGRPTMAIRYGLALAAVMLAMTKSSARACDDFEEEMALAAAREAVKIARTAVDSQSPPARAQGAASELIGAAVIVAAEVGTAPRRPTTELATVLAR
jgi:hypothetical protein